MKTPEQILDSKFEVLSSRIPIPFHPIEKDLIISAMKEYAYEWIEEAAMLASTCAANGVDIVNTVMFLKKDIDAQ